MHSSFHELAVFPIAAAVGFESVTANAEVFAAPRAVGSVTKRVQTSAFLVPGRVGRRSFSRAIDLASLVLVEQSQLFVFSAG
jgi:hypothetical protein